LVLDDSLELLCEEIVEALYLQEDVAWNRRTFSGAGAVRLSKARKDVELIEGSGE
jgi:hypothetical protein